MPDVYTNLIFLGYFMVFSVIGLMIAMRVFQDKNKTITEQFARLTEQVTEQNKTVIANMEKCQCKSCEQHLKIIEKKQNRLNHSMNLRSKNFKLNPSGIVPLSMRQKKIYHHTPEGLLIEYTGRLENARK